jgi:putative hydrolase of the HAD superfamily
MMKSRFGDYKAIYFDLDNTLIDRNAAFKACLKDYFDQFLTDLDFEKEWAAIQKKDDWGYTKRSEFSQWFINCFSPQNQTANDFWEFQRLHISTHIPAVEEFILHQLSDLKSKYKIGILTNGGIYNQNQKIKNSKLDQIFLEEEILISEKYQVKKPDAKLFKLLLHQLNINPNQLLYIGDDPINDIWGAKQLGIQTSWISWGRDWDKDYEADFNYNKLKTILEELCSIT